MTVNKMDPNLRRSSGELASTRSRFIDEQFFPLVFLLLTTLAVLAPAYGPEPLPLPTLLQKQNRFAGSAARLILRAQEMGYQVTLGEAWRSAEQAKFQVKINADKGIGISASLHTKRLALDLNLFQNGKYLAESADYEALGKWWEAQTTGQGPNSVRFRWGGRFRRQDGNHFSIEHEGVQ